MKHRIETIRDLLLLPPAVRARAFEELAITAGLFWRVLDNATPEARERIADTLPKAYEWEE